jgi:ABC-type cobalamin transport system permease subunit
MTPELRYALLTFALVIICGALLLWALYEMEVK